MDLLTTVRKEGSRGGRGDFKWTDVQSSSHRENYLGHSLMAPVGRWQTGRDLNWYAKGNANEDGNVGEGESSAEKAARERREEIKRIKEAEQDALARALGYEVPPRRNPNLAPLGNGGKDVVDKMVKETVDDGDTEAGRGLGFGKLGGAFQGDQDERIEGAGEERTKSGVIKAGIEHTKAEVGVGIGTKSEDDMRGIKVITGDDLGRDRENTHAGVAREAEADIVMRAAATNGGMVEVTELARLVTMAGTVKEITTTGDGREPGCSHQDRVTMALEDPLHNI